MSLNKDYIKAFFKECQIEAGANILVACSGGIDSTALVHLFGLAGLPFQIAHVNYQLRGKASDQDADFVANLAKLYKVPCHSATLAEIVENGLVELPKGKHGQAFWRDARLAFFNAILGHIPVLTHIATAHNLNDALETFLFKAGRRSDALSLAVMPPIEDNRLRPLIYHSRSEIESFCQQQSITWREDVSNTEDIYTRNAYRHQVVPALIDITPNYLEGFKGTLMRLHQKRLEYNTSVNQYVKHLEAKLLPSPNCLIIPRNYLPDTDLLEGVLKNYFRHKASQRLIDSIVGILDKHLNLDIEEVIDGISVFSTESTLQLTVKFDGQLPEDYTNKSPWLEYEADSFKVYKLTPELDLADATYALFNKSVIAMPLTCRIWQNGDKIKTAGGTKLVSDLLTNAKVKSYMRSLYPVFVDANGKLLWVPALAHDITVERTVPKDSGNENDFILHWERDNFCTALLDNLPFS